MSATGLKLPGHDLLKQSMFRCLPFYLCVWPSLKFNHEMIGGRRNALTSFGQMDSVPDSLSGMRCSQAVPSVKTLNAHFRRILTVAFHVCGPLFMNEIGDNVE